jgi:hypothetical protein
MCSDVLVVAKQNNTLSEICLDIIQVPALKLNAVHYKVSYSRTT